MTRIPRATPRPIETPLFEPDLLPFGAEEIVSVEFGVEVGVEGVEVATEVKYGAIAICSTKTRLDKSTCSLYLWRFRHSTFRCLISSLSLARRR
jgi:hypothetical protein